MRRKATNALIVFVLLAMAPCVNAHALDSSDPMRRLVCEALGGVDVTANGTLTLGDDVTAAAVCQLPGSTDTKAHVRDGSIFPNAVPLSPVTAAVYPPSGTVVTDASDRNIITSCAADLHIPALSAYPAVSQGLSTVQCRGYNTPTNSSAGCSVDWTGPTSVTLGVQPYGGRVVVNFSCVAFRPGIPTVMDYQYRDPSYPRLIYQANNVTGYLNVVW